MLVLPLVERKEEVLWYKLDPDGEPWLEETVVGLQEGRLSLVVEEHGSPEDETANLGCL